MFNRFIIYVEHSKNQELLLCLLFILLAVIWSLVVRRTPTTESKMEDQVDDQSCINEPENDRVSDENNADEGCSDTVNAEESENEISEESNISDEENE